MNKKKKKDSGTFWYNLVQPLQKTESSAIASEKQQKR